MGWQWSCSLAGVVPAGRNEVYLAPWTGQLLLLASRHMACCAAPRPRCHLPLVPCSGEPALTLAAALPQAQLLSTDLAHAFLELGKARAASAGLTNVSFETADAEDLHRYGDASFDAVTCSLGLM